MSVITTSFSGVVINQNATLSTTSSSPVVQTFTLPSDYERGTPGHGQVIPDLSGFQVFANVTAPATAFLAWTLDIQGSPIQQPPLPALASATNTGTPFAPHPAIAVAVAPPPGVWTTIASGTTTGTAQSGHTWFSVLFEDSIPIDIDWLSFPFRINITAMSDMTLGYSAGGTLMYRVLAAVADSGTDFLGNVYRSALLASSINNVNVIGSSDVLASWMSNPCPSQFGVESLYMDVRQNDGEVVIDRVTLDPMTPGIGFHIYYSIDPSGPGSTVAEWENLLWVPVYKTFQLDRMQTFALPEPITAKYICIEFTNLQARPYNPGNFQLPSTYKKYPQWVLDHFIGLFNQQDIDRLSSSVNVTYDALDLAYTYYQGDILQAPDPPLLSQVPTSQQSPFVQDTSDTADQQSLRRISLNFQPFLTQPALLGDPNSALAQYAAATAPTTYSTEVIQTAIGNTTYVSNVQRDALLVEKGFPAMFFYLPCRHAFRVVQALFQTNVAYFAGLRQLVLHRDVYTTFADQAQYNEDLGDGTNVAINDLNTFVIPPDPDALGFLPSVSLTSH